MSDNIAVFAHVQDAQTPVLSQPVFIYVCVPVCVYYYMVKGNTSFIIYIRLFSILHNYVFTHLVV